MDFVGRKRQENFPKGSRQGVKWWVAFSCRAAGEVMEKERPMPALTTKLSTTFLDPLHPIEQQHKVLVSSHS